VRAVEPFQQWQVVIAVVGRHRLGRAGQRIDPAGIGQGLEHQATGAFLHTLDVLARLAGTGVGIGERGGFAGGGHDIAEHADQPLGLGAVGGPDLLQPLAALLVQGRHALAEHAHHPVASRCPALVHKADQQCQPLVVVENLAHVRRVGHPRLAGEMRDLTWRDAVEPLLGRAERIQRGQVHQAVLELAQRRGAGGVLQPVELAAPSRRIDPQQSLQPSAPHPVRPGRHRSEHTGVDLAADRAAIASSVV
jgi:hypothetical protein